MRISEGEAAFEVSYEGLCSGPQGSFSYHMKITGDAFGVLIMEAEGIGLTDFPTNRTGFVVLHASEAAGGRLTIRHSDGRTEETTFPETISPDQPAFDIAVLDPRAGAWNDLHRHHGRRCLRDGGPAQLDRRLVQDVCPPSFQTAPLRH